MMMVDYSFDLWRKDAFFSAAEEVQESADRMESVYRAWERERRDRVQTDDFDELGRLLQTALGTTKWQLEELERAIKSSHENGSSEHTVARHTQFIIAIEDQISRIEKALRDSFTEEGKQPLRWVQLDEEEQDDLAVFLTGGPRTSQHTRGSCLNIGPFKGTVANQIQQKDVTDGGTNNFHDRNGFDRVKGFKEVVTVQNDGKYIVELEAKEVPKTQDEVKRYGEETQDEQKAAWRSEEIDSWRIVIADEDAGKRTMDERKEISTRTDNLSDLLRSIDFGAKLKWLWNSFRKEKDEENLGWERTLDYLNLRRTPPSSQGAILLSERSRNCFSSYSEDSNEFHVRQVFGNVGVKRLVQGSQQLMRASRFRRVMLILILTILLIVTFIFYVN